MIFYIPRCIDTRTSVSTIVQFYAIPSIVSACTGNRSTSDVSNVRSNRVKLGLKESKKNISFSYDDVLLERITSRCDVTLV